MTTHEARPTRLPDSAEIGTDALDRRTVLKKLGLVLAGAAMASSGLVAAQGSNHGAAAPMGESMRSPEDAMGHGMSAPGTDAAFGPPPYDGVGRFAPHAIPWHDGACAFCTMTIRTPDDAAQGPGFRERTYAQWAFASEARHFESIGCALGWAYVHAVTDGEGAALHVAPYDLGARPAEKDLVAGADAAFLWAERLPTSMMARWGAFRDQRAAAAFAANSDARTGIGRRRFADFALLADLAPLPVNNLVSLLARQAGLFT